MASDRTFGQASREDFDRLTGLELIHAMIAGRVPEPPIAGLMGFALIEAEEGRAVFEGVPFAGLLNPLGSVHGGWALTLIDSAAGCAVHTKLGAGVGYTTVETKVNFARPISRDSGTVRAIGEVVTHGRTIATAEARLLSQDGKILAHGTSTLMILPPR